MSTETKDNFLQGLVNPFRDPTMRKEYEAALFAFDTKHMNLFTGNLLEGGIQRRRSPDLGSSFATFFWGGYDRLETGMFNFKTASDKNMIGYAYYRAGKDVRKWTDAWK